MLFANDRAMGRVYRSLAYKGYTISQGPNGWTIMNCPNWSNGPVVCGPHSSITICQNIINRIISNSNR